MTTSWNPILYPLLAVPILGLSAYGMILRTYISNASLLREAIKAVDRLRDRHATPDWPSPPLAAKAKLVSAELWHILAELKQADVLPPRIDGSALADVASVVATIAGKSETTDSDLASALEALKHHLETRRALLLARRPIAHWLIRRWAHPAIETTPPEPPAALRIPDPAPPPDTGPGPFKPDEAALLAAVTEKFYASAAFKALGLALVGAVILAGSGIVYLGSRSVNLRDALNQTAEAQKKSLTEAGDQQKATLKTLGDAAEKTIKDATDRINAATTKIDNAAHDFVQDEEKANQRMADSEHAFETNSEKLQAKAVELVKVDFQAAINKAAEQFASPVEQDARNASSRLTPLNNSLDTLKTQTDDDLAELKRRSPQIEQLKQAADQAETITKQIQAVYNNQHAVEAAAADVQKTQAAATNNATAITNTAASVEADRKTAEQAATIARSNADALAKLYADETASLARVNNLLEQASGLVDIKAHLERVDALTARMDAYDRRPKPPAVDPATPAAGTPAWWKLIQSGLIARHFLAGTPDGQPGPKTAAAIRRYLAARPDHPPVTDTLSPEQAADLLPPGSVPPP